jgi:osmotically-inducible protein OsmY
MFFFERHSSRGIDWAANSLSFTDKGDAMSMLRRIGFITAVAMLVVGCQGYREGTPRTVGEFTDDAAIQSKLKISLINDKEISGLRINTEVHKGVVTLYGKVATVALGDRAVARAKAVKGVVKVENRLIVVTK